jgi:hypothetical protein
MSKLSTWTECCINLSGFSTAKDILVLPDCALTVQGAEALENRTLHPELKKCFETYGTLIALVLFYIP